MKFLKKFLKDQSGLGILEYVLLLAFVGTVAFAASPTLREQVGIMYEKQVSSTNNLNGMIDSENANRFDIEDETLIVKQPNESNPNENGFDNTKDPDATTNDPNTKEVVETVTNTTGIFDDQFSYNKDGFKGVIDKLPGTEKERVLEERTKVTSKNVSKYITKSTIQEFDGLLSIEQEEDGFTGTLTPAGEIETAFVSVDENTKVVNKNSGPVIKTTETWRTEPEYISSLFPESFLYEETLMFGGEEEIISGYTGIVSKKGVPTKTYLGKISVPDYRYALQNRDYQEEVDVSLSQEARNYTYVSPIQGENEPVNPNDYPSNYFYVEGSKEGLLKFVSKGSTKLHTRTDIIDATGKLTFSYMPGDTFDYNVDGFTGTLTAINDPYVSEGSYTAPITKEETATRTSTRNDLPDTIEYSKDGYVGTLVGQGVTTESVSGGYWETTGGWVESGYWETIREYVICRGDPICPSSGSHVIDTKVWRSSTKWVDGPSVWVDTSYTTYKQNYVGPVTLPAVDTRLWSRDYAGKASKVIDTYEYFANYSGFIYNKNHRNNDITPASIEYTDADAYKGTLYKVQPSLNVTLKSFRVTQTPKTLTNYRVYTPGVFPSATNTQTYTETYDYLDEGRFYGILNYIDKKTEFSFAQQENHKNITQNRTASTESALGSTFNYNDGTFWGTLNATNAATVISGTYIPSDTIYVTSQHSSYYNQNGYFGSLSQYVHDSVYHPSESMYISAHTSSYYSSGGFSGSLSQYLYSGSYTPADSKYASTSRSGTAYSDWLCVAGAGGKGYWDRQRSDYRPITISYSEGGYSGSLTVNGSGGGAAKSGSCTVGSTSTSSMSTSFTYSGTIYRPGSDTRVYRYQGTVTKPAYTTYDYRYQGYVTKPAVDTRTWSRDYAGVVSQTINYYKHYANYSGNTVRDNYLATYNYNVDYDGDISKNIMRDNYRHTQTYEGTLSKETYNFLYEYRRKFSGTLFKEENDDIIEYSVDYGGEVEEVR